MPQTFYVTQDEEILSIVGRLRESELLENVFVVPKRALILQSIVNLRILSREAEKLGKSVIIITQDEEGRALVEKAGIATRSYVEETSNIQDSRMLSAHVPSEISVGSAEFFSKNTPPETVAPQRKEPTAPIHHVPIRSDARMKVPFRGDGIRPPVAGVPNRIVPQPVVRQKLQEPVINRSPIPKQLPSVQEKLSAFYHGEDRRIRESSRPVSKPEPSHVSGRGSRWFLGFAVISIISIGAAAAVLFLPRAEISIVPSTLLQETEIEFEGTTSQVSDDRSVSMRIIEKEGEVSVPGTATGTAAGSGEKARGKIVIYNRYGSDSQPLVATTRFESSDGKIFRLAKGVTVPGVSTIGGKEEPGAVEAEVIADETGESYNIGPSDFSIPGFKGSAKYEKFSGKSQNRMAGGTSGEGGSMKAVSASDLDRAKIEAEKKFRSILEEMLRSELSQDDRFLIDSAEISVLGTPSAPVVGTVSAGFDYISKFKGRIVVFSESELKTVAERTLRARPSVEQSMDLHSISFTYNSLSPDFSSGKAIIKARVSGLFVSAIDVDAIRNEFLGKSGEGIRETLGQHPEIKKLDIVFRPKLLTSSVPKSASRVDVKIELP